ncbi:MAG TPA: protein kinase [Vicinamibacterales bacterium]|nr:protein kinase [Vicinamibacterales bacterium]
MTFPAGTKIGRYEIVSLVGAGGMGEVYRARDPQLGRDVAIKVLPAVFSSDPDRLSRFEQEAQAAGALNHPNILSIYDVTTHAGSPCVVSELLEGETLRERLTGAALPSRKAIDFALQVAHGLAAAHEKGIVHRDIKPENLFITRDGRVKILDFGLAKLIEAAVESAAQTSLPTRRAHTDPGAVMGTVGYMSPEQLRGLPIDPRTDIFSFGAVLYEMLSGRRAFGGTSAADTISAILKEDPPELSGTSKDINAGVDRVVRRCLEKNREERFHSASDLAFALEALSGTQSSGTATVAATVAATDASWLRRERLNRVGWIAAALFLVSTLALAVLHFGRPEPLRETMRFSLPVPEKGGYGDGLTLAPDGQSVAFVAIGGGGVTSLWVRSLDSTVARELAGTEGASLPFWSPDSRFIGFFTGNKLKKIEASGGPSQSLADITDGARGGAWGPDGTILFTPGYVSPLHRVPASGAAAATPATAFDASRKQTSHRWPSFLPDGRHFLYFSRATQKEAEGIYVGSLDSKASQFILNTSQLASYAPAMPGSATGHLLFMRDKTLVAQPFDTRALQLSGEPFAVADGVLSYPGESGPTAYAAFSASMNGHLAYLTGKESLSQMGWFDRKGIFLGPVVPPGDYHEPSLSPDGKRIVFGREDKDSSDLWLLDVARGTPMTKFTFDPAPDVCPLWSPDGSRIIFSSSRGGMQQLYQKVSSGGGTDEVLLRTNHNAFADGWATTKEGSFILYETESVKTRYDLYVLPLFGDRKPVPFLQTEFNETHAQFSPDGRWVVYTSDESGRAEVYVRSFPVSGGQWQVSTNGGDQAQWRGDGRELFYLTPDKKLMAVPVTPGVSFETGVHVALFATRVPTTGHTDDRNNYVPAADGQRFLINSLVEDGTTQPITLVLNWAAGLKSGLKR